MNIQNTEVKTLSELLFEKYKKLTLNTTETAQSIDRSAISLSRDRAAGVGIPFTKLGRGNGSDRVMYNIYDIAKFIVSRKTRVA